eukprot:SAG31_NODE_1014_length_10366_cov_2.357129_2_plen_81_part_00
MLYNTSRICHLVLFNTDNGSQLTSVDTNTSFFITSKPKPNWAQVLYTGFTAAWTLVLLARPQPPPTPYRVVSSYGADPLS